MPPGTTNSTSRYSRDRILIALQPLLVDSFGIDDDEMPLPGERIDEHLKRMDIWPDVDLADLWFRCQKTFGFKADQAQWKAFIYGTATTVEEWERDVAPKLTYDALADFIAARVTVVSFAPIEIAGHRCAKAGAFLGVREIINRGVSAHRRFAPSTTIHSELTRSEVEHLWSSMAWMCPSPPPALRACWSDRIASSAFLWVLAMGGTGFAFLCTGEPDLFLVFCVMAFVGLVPYILLRSFENPLPQGIVTFSDLARRLAEANVFPRPDNMAV